MVTHVEIVSGWWYPVWIIFTDYKFLGILKGMFADVPILGLTATSTSNITIDVQKMLCIQGCLVLKASFNRPNLYYEVWSVYKNEQLNSFPNLG
jgi:superfamily II DNA helicase RecQ